MRESSNGIIIFNPLKRKEWFFFIRQANRVNKFVHVSRILNSLILLDAQFSIRR